MSIISNARARVACRIQSMQTIFFDYQCDSVSRTAVKFRNHAAAAPNPLPVLIIDGEKIILLYATFTHISSHCQKYLQISIFLAETGSLDILFISIMFKSFTVTRYTNCFEVLVFFVFDRWASVFPHLNTMDYFCSK